MSGGVRPVGQIPHQMLQKCSILTSTLNRCSRSTRLSFLDGATFLKFVRGGSSIMFRSNHFARSASPLAMLIALSTGASADMGRAPVTVQGTYVSFEGGYLLQDAGGVIGYGISSLPGTMTDVVVSPDTGWFAGAMIGFANSGPFIAGLPFHRVELYGLGGSMDDNASPTSPPLLDISLKNDDATQLITGGLSGRTSSTREFAEGGIRFEADDIVNATTSITWTVAPFIRWSGEDTQSVVTGCCDLVRASSVDTWMYGIVVAAEPELWLTSQVALVGRLGAGIYGFSSDGDYRSSSTLPGPDPFAAHLADSEDGVGFRGQLGAGFKFKLTSAAFLETFAEADYFSDVGTAHTANNQPGDTTASHSDTTDLWELRAGARLTFGFGP